MTKFRAVTAALLAMVIALIPTQVGAEDITAEIERLYSTAVLTEPPDILRKEPPPTTETYEVTAYTAGYESTGKRPGHPLYGVTASGEYVEDGVTIACPPEIPFGTILRIEGVGTFDGYGDERRCDDRGGAIKGKRIDVYISDLATALELGRRDMEVEIIEN